MQTVQYFGRMATKGENIFEAQMNTFKENAGLVGEVIVDNMSEA